MKNKVDIILMGDNNLETVGGEQESIKIIIDGIKDSYSLGVIQPGIIKKPVPNVRYFEMTDSTRLKHEINKPISFLNYIVNVKKIIDEYVPSIIHTQAQVSFFIISLLKKLKLIPSETILIHTERSLYIKYNFLFKIIFFFFMKELDVLVTTTNYNLNLWKEALNKKNISLEFKVIENTAGKTFERFNPELLAKDSDTYSIGFSGRYHSVKNWPLAVKISEKLYSKLGNKIKVKMNVGCLDDPSLNETKKMFNYMETLLGNNFEGKINVDILEMDKFYYEIDFFILTSQKDGESFGRTLVEAMSRDTIVLTTDAGGPVEVVSDSRNVLENSDEFVEAIINFINNKDRMADEKKKNMKRARKVYSLENNIKKHINMYSTVLEWEMETIK